MADEDLERVAAVVAGDPGAWPAFQAHVGRIVDACLSKVVGAAPWLRRHEADLRQGFELMLVQDDCKVLRTYAGKARLTTWVHVLATRYFRRQAGRIKAREGRLIAGVPERASEPDGSPEASVARSEEAHAARAAVAELPEADQVLLAMMYEQGLDASQVAPHLGLTPSGVRMRKARLLARLADRLRGLRR